MATRAWNQIDGLARAEKRAENRASKARFAPAEPVAVAEVQPVSAVSRYGEGRSLNWPAIGFAVVGHAVALFLAIQLNVIHITPPKREPLVVNLIAEKSPPPPAEPKTLEPKKAVIPVVTPKAVVTPPVINQPVVSVSVPPPPQAVVVAPPAPPVPPAGPVAIGDLSSKMVAFTPPQYPVESRRKREQGTVELRVLLGLDGRVQDIDIERSSGSSRLDQAALAAVRRWRWAPTVRGGAAVMVRGIVEIPFVLKG